jgi:hypothetical protein
MALRAPEERLHVALLDLQSLEVPCRHLVSTINSDSGSSTTKKREGTDLVAVFDGLGVSVDLGVAQSGVEEARHLEGIHLLLLLRAQIVQVGQIAQRLSQRTRSVRTSIPQCNETRK